MSCIPRPTKAFDESGYEVLHRLRTGHKDEEQTLSPDSPVPAGHLEDFPMRKPFTVNTLRERNAVAGQTVTGHDSFLFVEELCTIGRINRHVKVNSD